jgi:hypothetical protein
VGNRTTDPHAVILNCKRINDPTFYEIGPVLVSEGGVD